MAESNRIEDLRKRYHENPRRFFAPLANEYRKGGFFDRAILLCEKHLAEQPDNMNGLVVYGQVLFESGKQEEARVPFEMALKLDQENLIALRHLGDIARSGGDIELAKSWYVKVLEVDRRNDEVLDILEQLGGVEGDAPDAPRPSVSASSLISVAPNVSVSGGEGGLDMLDLDAPPPPPPPAPKPAAPIKTMVINVKELAAADLRSAQAKEAAAASPPEAAAETVEIVAAAPSVPAAAEPPARPSKRASLLDIDFSDLPVDDAPLAVPDAPVLSAEAAEYGFVDVAPPSAPDEEKTLIVDAPPKPAAAEEIPGLEMADFSAEVSPMAGLESAEFIGGDVAAPMEGLDRVNLTAADIDAPAGIEGLATTADLAAMDLPSPAGAAELATDPITEPISFDDLDVSESTDSTPLPTLEPAMESRPKPRMTRADMGSLPLLADYGLEDDDVEPRRAQPTPTFVTETMAALYIKQGFRKEAIEVYRQLIIQDPADAGLKDRLAALERGDDAGLEFDAPPPDAVEPAPAPANAALSEVSFAGVGLNTPSASQATPIKTPVVDAGPSAREFFAGFAKRGASPNAANGKTSAPQSPVSATGWPLDAIFGAAHEVRDLHAAEMLAGVGTFAGPSGGTGFDELFAAGGTPAPAARGVSRASQTLKFDQFFAKEGPAAAHDAAPAAPDASPAAAGDEELGKFQGWLKGLKP